MVTGGFGVVVGGFVCVFSVSLTVDGGCVVVVTEACVAVTTGGLVVSGALCKFL